MRRTILGALVAASLGLPAVALAKPTTGMNTRGDAAQPLREGQQSTRDRAVRPHDMPANGSGGGSLGGGMQGGNETGHVTGPGNAPIDNSTRGPINDVQPGQGTDDTHQSKNPKPVP